MLPSVGQLSFDCWHNRIVKLNVAVAVADFIIHMYVRTAHTTEYNTVCM